MIEKTVNTEVRRTFFVDILGVTEKVELVCMVPTIINDAKIKATQQKIEKLEKLILVKEEKLANAKFLVYAPVEAIQKECDALADLEAQRDNEQTLLNQWTQQ